MIELFKNTVAYRIVSGDKRRNALSHAYLLVCQDKDMLSEYLKIIAKTIICDDKEGFCNECRSCRLIDKGIYTDVSIYPKAEGGRIVVADVDEMVSQSYIKPFEGDKRVFVFSGAENMLAQAQNKLLKTLEEPPVGVYVIIGATNDSAILSTVKSRVKKLNVPDFAEKDIFEYLKIRFPERDAGDLLRAASFADGKIGLTIKYTEDGLDSTVETLVCDMLENMQSSKDILEYSVKIDKNNFKEYLMFLKQAMNRCVRFIGGEEEKSGAIRRISRIYGVAACLAIIEKVNQCERSLFYNGNVTMLADRILLGVLEEKYKWKKL